MCIWLEHIFDVDGDREDVTCSTTPSESLNWYISLSFLDCEYHLVYERSDLYLLSKNIDGFTDNIIFLHHYHRHLTGNQ